MRMNSTPTPLSRLKSLLGRIKGIVEYAEGWRWGVASVVAFDPNNPDGDYEIPSPPATVLAGRVRFTGDALQVRDSLGVTASIPKSDVYRVVTFDTRENMVNYEMNAIMAEFKQTLEKNF